MQAINQKQNQTLTNNLLICSVRMERCNDRVLPRVLDGNTASSNAGTGPQTRCLTSGTAPGLSGSSPINLVRSDRITALKRVKAKFRAGRDLILWQLNLNHDTKVTGEIREVLGPHRVDLLLMQEPYICNRRGITGLGSSAKVACAEGMPKAAIMATKEDVNMIILRHLTTEHCVCAQVNTPSGNFYAITSYFQFADSVETHLKHLGLVLEALRGERYIISVDANAKSPSWGGNVLDESGIAVEEFIGHYGLILLNDPAQIATYSHRGNETYIDLTMVSSNMYQHIKKWTVLDGITTSDHRVIEIRISTKKRSDFDGIGQPSERRPGRFLFKKVNRPKFDGSLQASLDAILSMAPLECARDIEGYAKIFTKQIIEACEASMPRKKWRYKCSPWWTTDLTKLKKKKIKIVKRFQKLRRGIRNSKNPDIMRCVRFTYVMQDKRQIVRNYKKTVHKAKISSFRKFVTEEGNKNPWGICYRSQADKLRVEMMHGNMKTQSGCTKGAEETAQAILNVLVPDAPPNEIKEIQEGGDNDECSTLSADELDFTEEEVIAAVKSLPNGRAPGPDMIEVEVLKMSFPVLGGALVRLVNACLRHGVFPSVWKTGTLRALYKGGEKDKLDPRSYRPICLLPVLGKLLEKLILVRMNKTVLAGDKLSDRQYGFRKGRSTEDALIEFRHITDSCAERYVLGIFFDITGAFDNVLWSMILKGLRERACPKNVYSLIKSYFSDRTVSLSWGGGKTVSKKASRGCPQGSVLGPSCWNVVFDSLLKILVNKIGKKIVAYADDLSAAIAGNTREEIEVKGQKIVDIISGWCRSAGLQLSESKTASMYVKYIPRALKSFEQHASMKKEGRIRKDKMSMRSKNKKYDLSNSTRKPVIKLNGNTIKYVKTFRLLGINFGEKLKVHSHCEMISAALKGLFQRLTSLAKSKWGLNCNTLKIIYKGVFVARAAYAARAWYDLATNEDIKKLERAQRSVLIGVTKAYRSVSTDALPVIAGVLPIKIAIKERVALSAVRSGIDIEFGKLKIKAGTELHECRNNIKKEALRLWQSQWEIAPHGRVTFEYFRDVRSRFVSGWAPDHYVTQFITGHGKFASWLFLRGIADSEELCDCGSEESMQHILVDCPTYQDKRVALWSRIKNGLREWPSVAGQLVSTGARKLFATFAKEVLLHKERKNLEHIRTYASSQ